MKRQTLNWKEVLSNHTCKGFVSHIYINSQNLTEKQTGLSREIEGRKKIQMEILELGNTVTKIKTHWMGSIAEQI